LPRRERFTILAEGAAAFNDGADRYRYRRRARPISTGRQRGAELVVENCVVTGRAS